MKKLFGLIFIGLIFCGCEAVEDCFKKSGQMVSRTVDVSGFQKIIVHKGISLVITQSTDYEVTIVSGENLLNGIEATVTDNTLTLRDDTACNWTRDYGVTTVYVRAPNITDIISKTEQKISSGNLLTYPSLRLEALDGSEAGTGDFHLEVDNDLVWIESNNVAGFYLSGTTQTLTAAFYEGNGPLHADAMTATDIHIFHRGSNHMYVHPVNQITGNIYSTGNVYCHPEPPTVDVDEHYNGRLIFTN